MRKIITLTTDFGLQDYYVSAMKAVILKIAPDVRLIDISHEIPDQDIMAGSWVVQNSTPLFPEGSVHMVVVDPGVGTERKPIALRVDGQFYVGPDNGIFSLLTEDKSFEGVCLTNEEYWNRPTSN
ncbi:MAG: SAM-dependent chlorinase/fluorinase, partial [Balneolaceae bacterium]|nr:SAM-dependent chlorinase/fluorinase [Balneolaceae bacterium]